MVKRHSIIIIVHDSEETKGKRKERSNVIQRKQQPQPKENAMTSLLQGTQYEIGSSRKRKEKAKKVKKEHINPMRLFLVLS